MTAEARDFLEADICLWCGNYSCTCEDAPDPVRFLSMWDESKP